MQIILVFDLDSITVVLTLLGTYLSYRTVKLQVHSLRKRKRSATNRTSSK